MGRWRVLHSCMSTPAAAAAAAAAAARARPSSQTDRQTPKMAGKPQAAHRHRKMAPLMARLRRRAEQVPWACERTLTRLRIAALRRRMAVASRCRAERPPMTRATKQARRPTALARGKTLSRQARRQHARSKAGRGRWRGSWWLPSQNRHLRKQPLGPTQRIPWQRRAQPSVGAMLRSPPERSQQPP